MLKYWIATFAFLLFNLMSFSQQTLIYCGSLIDGIANEPKPEMTIVVEGNIILTIQEGYILPKEFDNVIDLKDKIGKLDDSSQIFVDESNTIRNEALSALVMLGFARNAVNKILDKNLKAADDIIASASS